MNPSSYYDQWGKGIEDENSQSLTDMILEQQEIEELENMWHMPCKEGVE